MILVGGVRNYWQTSMIMRFEVFCSGEKNRRLLMTWQRSIADTKRDATIWPQLPYQSHQRRLSHGMRYNVTKITCLGQIDKCSGLVGKEENDLGFLHSLSLRFNQVATPKSTLLSQRNAIEAVSLEGFLMKASL